MRWFSSLRSRLPSDGERGQILIMSVLVLTVMLAFSGLAIDVGLWVHTRTKLQADADSMALAGAQKLCADAGCDYDAIALATSYADLNNVGNTEVKSVVVGTACDGTISTNHDLITVRTERTVPTFLAKLVGIVSADIDTCATARKAAVAGGTGIVPFGIEDTCLGSGDFGTFYDLKYDSDPDSTFEGCDKTNGNFGLLSIDTSGAGPGCGSPPDTSTELKLKQAICFGANRFLCSQGATDCVGVVDDDSCSGNHAQDDESCTEPGNTTSAIKEGLSYRMTHTSTACDEWDEVTFEDGGLRPECNPWRNEESRRVIMIPVVHGLFTGSGGTKIVTVQGFALFFLDDFVAKDCKGSDCDITGKFIETSLTASYQGLDDLSLDSKLTVVTLVK